MVVLEKDVLASLLVQENWDRYGSLFSPEFFTSSSHATLFELLSEYYSKLDSTVVQINLETLNKLIYVSVPKQEEAERLYEIVKELYDIQVDQVEPLIRKALLSWRTQKIILEAEDSFASGSFIPSVTAQQLKELSKAYQKKEEPEVPIVEGIQQLLVEAQERKEYPTGISELDEALGGGIWAGQVGLVVAPYFGCKSLSMTSFGAANLRLKTSVLGWTCENSRPDWIIRFFQNLLGWDRDRVVYNPVLASEEIKKLELPPWEIKDCRSSGIYLPNVRRDIETFLEKYPEATSPLVLIDQAVYGGIRPADSRIQEPRFQLSKATEELIEIASEFNVAIWAPTQATRAGLVKPIITGADVAECIDMPRKVDVVLTFNQTVEEKESGAMRVYLDKARERQIAKHIYSVRVETSTQKMESFT